MAEGLHETGIPVELSSTYTLGSKVTCRGAEGRGDPKGYPMLKPIAQCLSVDWRVAPPGSKVQGSTEASTVP